MSAPISGPEGYEYQYLISSYLILLYIKNEPSLEAYIEEMAREDLAFNFGIGRSVDFQFKKRKAMLDIKVLAKCLVKFDAYSSNTNVLSKLSSGSISSFCLVSNARAGDFAIDLGVLLQSGSITNRVINESQIDRQDELLKALEEVFANAKSKAEIKRKDFVKRQVEAIRKSNNLPNILKTVFVLENADPQLVKSQIFSILSQTGIPSTRQELLLHQLIEIIKTSRGTSVNVASLFQIAIRRTVENLPEVDRSYIEVGIEDSLISFLSTEKHILLTGSSLCGKSAMAVYLTNKLFEKVPDLSFRFTSNLLEAENFLLDNSAETRLCLLDDPFGTGYNDNTTGDYHKFETLLHQVISRNGKYLITTSNLKALTVVTTHEVIRDAWKNVTITDRKFLRSLWESYQQSTHNEMLNKIVADILINDPEDTLLQPGQLRFLQRNGHLIETLSETSVRHLANFKSQDIEAKILKSGKPIIDIMLQMAITSTYINGLTMQELRFLVDSDTAYTPGLNDKEYHLGMRFIGGGRSQQPTLAQYHKLPPISKDIEDCLDSLIRMGMVEFRNGEFAFSHSIYESGAKRLLNAVNNPFATKRILNILEKATGSLSINTAINGIKSCYIIAEYFKEDKGTGTAKKLLRIAETALKSTFVNVRTQAFHYIVKFTNFATKEQNELIESWIRSNDYFSSDFYYQNGVAFIPNQEYFSFGDGVADRLFGRLHANEIWEQYQSAPPHLSPPDAFDMLNHLNRSSRHSKLRIDHPLELLEPFMRYDEEFVVAEAAYLLAASLNDQTYPLNRWLFVDDRPIIKFQLLKGLLKAYAYFEDDAVLVDVVAKMKNLLDNRFSSLAALDLFTQFNSGHTSFTFDWENEVEEFAVTKLWDLWADLTPIFVKNLPKDIRIQNARFTDAILHAKVNDNEKLFKMTFAWVNWLKDHFIERQTYESHISRCILTIYNHNLKNFNIDQRTELTNTLYSLPNIHFHGHLLRIITFNWISFSEDEQSLLEGLFLKEPIGYKAIIVTSNNCPDILSGKLLQIGTLMDKSPDWIIANIDKNLLKSILVLLYDYPPTADLPYNNYGQWNPVIAKSLELPDNCCFLVATKTFLFYYLGFKIIGPCNWPDKNTILSILKNQCNDEQILSIFIFLIDQLGNQHRRCRYFLTYFFDNISDALKDQCGAILEQHIEMISNGENLAAIPNHIWTTYINIKLEMDNALIQTYKYLVKPDPTDEKMRFFAGFINHAVETKSLRLQKVILRIRDFARNNKEYFREEEIKAVEDYLQYFFAMASKQREELRRKIEANFEDLYLD
ncbi:nSTAND3 domain-containing NTPase [Sphingobacterium sp. MYb388]|uniref:nSTAND3 domain-containing NTPase n=1 Tax=Sphingobacterium sp. MYb388 TaxID=2745437 RepID=UPI00309DCEF2